MIYPWNHSRILEHAFHLLNHSTTFFFVCLLTETKSKSITTEKENEANIQPS